MMLNVDLGAVVLQSSYDIMGNTCGWSLLIETSFKQVFIAHLCLLFMTNKCEYPDCICYTGKTLNAHYLSLYQEYNTIFPVIFLVHLEFIV